MRKTTKLWRQLAPGARQCSPLEIPLNSSVTCSSSKWTKRHYSIIHTPSPNPSWKPGDKISSPVEEMVSLGNDLQLSERFLLIKIFFTRQIQKQ